MNETNVGVYSKEYSFLKLPYLFIDFVLLPLFYAPLISVLRAKITMPPVPFILISIVIMMTFVVISFILDIRRDHDDLRRDIRHHHHGEHRRDVHHRGSSW